MGVPDTEHCHVWENSCVKLRLNHQRLIQPASMPLPHLYRWLSMNCVCQQKLLLKAVLETHVALMCTECFGKQDFPPELKTENLFLKQAHGSVALGRPFLRMPAARALAFVAIAPPTPRRSVPCYKEGACTAGVAKTRHSRWRATPVASGTYQQVLSCQGGMIPIFAHHSTPCSTPCHIPCPLTLPAEHIASQMYPPLIWINSSKAV